MYSIAHSIAVSEEMGLVAVLWLEYPNRKGINIYSLNTKKFVLVYDVDYDVTIIRISSRDRKIITGNRETGEIKRYDLEQLFSFEAMKGTLACLVSQDEYEKLRKYFGVTEKEVTRLEAGDEDGSKKLSDGERRVKRMEYLLTIIEEKRQLTPYNINTLIDAVSKLGDESHTSDLKGPMEAYSLHGKNMKLITVEEMMKRQRAWGDEKNHLISKLETAKSVVKKHEKILDDLQGELARVKKEAQELEEDLANAKLLIKDKETTIEQLAQSKAESGRQEKSLTAKLEHSEKSIALSNRQREKLAEELKQTKQSNSVISEELRLLKSKSSRKIELLKSELSETKQELLTKTKELGTTNMDLHATRIELKQYQLDFAKESKALKEVLNQAKDVIAELQKRPLENRPLDDSEETKHINEGGAILAAEFGRLTVAVAEYLTLGDCLKLANVCNIPKSDCDMVHRVGLSYNESPGIKLFDVLKKRQVINMFDVTNLQKALAMLQLEAINHDVVAPYQKKIGEEHYERFKIEEMFTWEEVNKFLSTAKVGLPQQKICDKVVSPDNDTGYTSQTEATAEAGEDNKRSLMIVRPHHLLYTEQSVGREGGTIKLTNVSLTVPPDALHENHVIAISVMNESPFPLDREVDTARMTPLIKLEPLGLTFKKPARLKIPHSALISEPENHDVIIHSGQLTKTDDDTSDCIRWTEEGSIPTQLKEKYMTVDIQCLTFLSASLVSQTSAPPLHIVRAVPFVDGVRNSDDDITLTICFCSDNEAEYNMLLSDYQTKLPLEQYSTLHLHRHSERDEDDAGFLSVIVTSVNNTYLPDKEQAIKKFGVSYLCTASRVSHQLRLKRSQSTVGDIVDILLTFTQAGYEPTRISLKTRIKDLIISEESETFFLGPISQGSKMYEEMFHSISANLDTDQCKKLAAYFQLTVEETEIITSSKDPGNMLMKTLEERSLVDSQKMLPFLQGLQKNHLDDTAELVAEYIRKIPRSIPKEVQKAEGDKHFEEDEKDTPVSQTITEKSKESVHTPETIPATLPPTPSSTTVITSAGTSSQLGICTMETSTGIATDSLVALQQQVMQLHSQEEMQETQFASLQRTTEISPIEFQEKLVDFQAQSLEIQKKMLTAMEAITSYILFRSTYE